MKVLKYFAALSAVIITAAACKTQPKSTGNTTPDPIQAALNDAISQIGGVAGLAGYRQTYMDTTGIGGTIARTEVNEFHIDSAYTALVQPAVTAYNGTGDIGYGETTFNNEVVDKSVSSSGVTVLRPVDDYDTTQFSDFIGTTITEAELGNYRIVRITPTADKTWASTNIGGRGAWEDKTLPPALTYYIKEDNDKLHVITVSILDTKAVQFSGNPLNPSAIYTYTKK